MHIITSNRHVLLNRVLQVLAFAILTLGGPLVVSATPHDDCVNAANAKDQAAAAQRDKDVAAALKAFNETYLGARKQWQEVDVPGCDTDYGTDLDNCNADKDGTVQKAMKTAKDKLALLREQLVIDLLACAGNPLNIIDCATKAAAAAAKSAAAANSDLQTALSSASVDLQTCTTKAGNNLRGCLTKASKKASVAVNGAFDAEQQAENAANQAYMDAIAADQVERSNCPSDPPPQG